MGHKSSKAKPNDKVESIGKQVAANQLAQGTDVSSPPASSGEMRTKKPTTKPKAVPQLSVERPVERVIEDPVSPSALPLDTSVYSSWDGRKLNRAHSALQQVKRAFSGIVFPTRRSKSMPVLLTRRADINLDDDTLSRLKVMQDELRHTFESLGDPRKPSSGSLNEVKLMKYMSSSCSNFCFGEQWLQGTPGQIREVTGTLPSNIFVSCVKGLKSYADSSPNQDNFSYCKYNDYEFFSVQDGHGTCGHMVSYRTVRVLPYYIIRSSFFPNSMEEAIKDGYASCQADLVANSVESNYDIQVSGCACVLAIKHRDRVWFSHIGDCRIVLAEQNTGNIIHQTMDHKPTLPDEKLRLEANGSEIQTFHFDNGHVEISRVFVKGKDYPGLCMSRSFGDQSVKAVGVNAVPEIHCITIDPQRDSPLFMVLASDGVWEFIPSKLVASSLSKRIATEGGNKCIDRIVTESKKRWKQSEGTYCDDITAMVVVFNSDQY